MVSAYCNKIEPHLEFGLIANTTNPIQVNLWNKKHFFFEALRQWILSKYRPLDLLKWYENHGSYDIQVSFTDYMEWIVNSDDNKLNEHFAPTIVGAQPCRIKYTFYANFKNFSRDVHLLLRKLNASQEFFTDHSSHSPGKETWAKLKSYYSQLPPPLKRQLFYHIFQELDFYYHLYPEEQWSHAELLEIREPVLEQSD